MEEENGMQNPEEGQAESAAVDLGKFKSVEALAHAYKELEAEFTRRSQKLKALEERAPQAAEGVADDDLFRAVTQNEGVRTRVVNEYLSSLSSVPLMTGVGTGVTAPVVKPKSIREAGSLALGYFRNSKK